MSNKKNNSQKQFHQSAGNNDKTKEAAATVNENEEIIDDIIDLGPDDNSQQLEAEVLKLNEELEQQKKKYLLLYADFDNFRKHSIKDKAELIKNGGEQAYKGLLPILDDFERGIEAADKSEEGRKYVEGFELIYNKLKKYLEQNGVKEFDNADNTFDADRHEAISAIPAPQEALKGKIIDTVQKGYTMNGKVIRHAKVVVGQ